MWVATSFLAVLLFTVSVPLAATLYGVHLLAAFATSLAMAGALPLAVRLPWVAAALATIGLLAFALLSAPSEGAPWPWPVTTIIGQGALVIVLGLTRPWWVGFAAWLAGVVVTAPFAFVDVGAAANVVTAAAVTALALTVAILIAQRRLIGAELFRERAHSASEQQRRVLVEERNRIARELHDVVAHGLSIIHVQATSAPYRVEGLSDGREGRVRRDRGIRSLGDDRDAPTPRGAPQLRMPRPRPPRSRASATCRRSWPPSSGPACR